MQGSVVLYGLCKEEHIGRLLLLGPGAAAITFCTGGPRSSVWCRFAVARYVLLLRLTVDLPSHRGHPMTIMSLCNAAFATRYFEPTAACLSLRILSSLQDHGMPHFVSPAIVAESCH